MEIIEENDRLIRAKYENCKISIILSDFLGIRQKYHPFQLDDSKMLYISNFECDFRTEKKGNGRILLSLILDHIKKTYFKSENVMVSLIACAKTRIDETGREIVSDNAKLIKYYKKLGFRLITKDDDIMVARLSLILTNCKSFPGGRTSRKKRPITQSNKISRNRKKNILLNY